MDTTTATETEPHRPDAPPWHRRARTAGVAVVLLILAFVLLLTGLRVARAGALPGTVVDGTPVGGLDDDRLRAAIERLAQRRADAPVRVTVEDRFIATPAHEAGYELDVDATVDAVLRRGRQANPFRALTDQLRAFGGTLPVEAVETVDDARLEPWARGVVAQLERPPVEGTLRFEDASVEPVYPQPGALVDLDALVAQVRDELLAGPPAQVSGRVTQLPPETSRADVETVLDDAQRAVSAPVRLRRGQVAISVSPAQIAELLEIHRQGDEDGARLRLAIDPARLDDVIPHDELHAVESSPADARIRVVGGSVQITPSVEGFAFSAEKAAAQILEVATGTGARDAPLEGNVLRPSMTTEDARALQIVEPVSSFTTNHKCCQSRVTNIHRIADLVDGALIKPGQTFSVNAHVGKRTKEKGFVEGGAIFDGEYVDEVGGGVSQFATTMFNAAYFGGYAIPEHKPHSYYISRYPVGREATLSYPHVDLKVRNNSPYGVIVKTSYTDTSITVTFYGKKWVEVDSVTGERRNIKQPETQVRENPDLPPGTSKVVQRPAEGFDITVTRILRFPSGETKREEFFTRYLPQPQIIERNSGGESSG